MRSQNNKDDSEILGQVKEKLKGYPIVIKAPDALSVETIDNAIFYSENPGAEAKRKAPADFLASNDVLTDGNGREQAPQYPEKRRRHSLDQRKGRPMQS